MHSHKLLTQCMRMHILPASRTDLADRFGRTHGARDTEITRNELRFAPLGPSAAPLRRPLPGRDGRLDGGGGVAQHRPRARSRAQSLQWIVSGYVLGYGGLLLLGGR